MLTHIFYPSKVLKALAIFILVAGCFGIARSAEAYDLYTGSGLHPYVPSSDIPNYLNGFTLYGTTTPDLVEGSYDLTGGCAYSQNTSSSGAWDSGPVAYLDTACSGVAMTGTYYLYFFGNRVSGNIYNTIQGYDVLVNGEVINDFSTHIISISPENGTTTGNTVNISLSAYVSPADLTTFSGVRVTLHNIDQNVLLGSLISPYDIVFLDSVDLDTAGPYSFSSTTVLADGNYRLHAELLARGLGSLTHGNFGTFDIVDSQFIVYEETFIGHISATSFSALQSIFGSTVGTSTLALSGTCNPFSGSISTLFYNTEFNPISCLAFLLIPDAGLVYDSLSSFRTNVSTHFPLGYVTDLFSIFSTTTERGLPVIDATIPPGIPGTGASIHLDLAHSLDFILNATTSSFANISASSTDTFYDITSYYWNIFVYISIALYLARRILGSHVIPKIR
jgi:hypothetical protein